MYLISICDDNKCQLSIIENLITEYFNKNDIPFKYDIFSNPMNLLDAFEEKEYHILFLDVLMPGMNGIEVAKEVRKINKLTKIIFLTSSPEFAVQSYSVDAYYYLIKPINKKNIYSILDDLFQSLNIEEDSLFLPFTTGNTKIPLNNIEYVEVIDKKLQYHFIDGCTIEGLGTLSDLFEELKKYSYFIKCHRSYIINLNWIQEVSSKSLITFNNNHIPVSRTIYSEVKNTYIHYLFEKDNM